MTAPNSTFFIKQNDTSPVIEEYLRNADGSALDVSASTVVFHMRDGFGTVKVSSPATIVNGPQGWVRYSWIAADTNQAGTFYREWQVTLPSGRIVTTPNYTDYPVQISTDIA